jgi:hypothetical protein
MTLMQVAHGRYQSDTFAGLAVLAHGGTQFSKGMKRLHC